MASRISLKYLATVLRAPRAVSPSALRLYPHLSTRFAHTIPRPSIPTQDGTSSSTSTNAKKSRKQIEPHYQLKFTCIPCNTRSTHIVSKQGYHKGSVLISCPECRNRHIISDNLNIFGDRKITVEDLLREKGQLVKRGTLGEDEDIEFWADDTTDLPNAGDATPASARGEGETDEAKKLRETRNPSSQATNPTPSSSVLPGDSGTRPSVQGASHQNTTPSTRRQYSTERAHSNVWIEHAEAVKQYLERESEVKDPKSNGSEDPIQEEFNGDDIRSEPISDSAASFERESRTAQLETESTSDATEPWHRMQNSPAQASTQDYNKRRYRFRRVSGDANYRGPRFISSECPHKITAQITPGVVSYYRPPRGEPIEKKPEIRMKKLQKERNLLKEYPKGRTRSRTDI
ncbi:DNL zinc finger-domain-containing protein [Xylaria bambusicola]|uniref:DNL zinc finger-domain-containing protein n=1 Tax=Xylaria bambusicola TaxID=326684 RepID=UPI002007CCF8|nr:DNL zinc finger-domain-containing protein [Xylaria bambusicola]KAI0508632.1 DNL zinc finger-domain-containing protein [Xylaria bambusicola]